MSGAYTLPQLLAMMPKLRASDLHLRVARPPHYRIDGFLHPLDGHPSLTQDRVIELVREIMNDSQFRRLQEEFAVDFSYAVKNVGRFRCALFRQQGLLGGVFRRIPEEIPTLDQIHAPAQLLAFAREPRGLVLVTGPTGSGKTTTLAAMLDVINTERAWHILTIEDPIEFVHAPKRSLVNQRELGLDTPSFSRALRDALREDPDVILIGEMRDLDTISIALTAAETGHLVFATLHTNSAPSTIDRIIDVFPAGQQEQVRIQLAASLRGVVTQTLLPRSDGKGRMSAHEILVVDHGVSNAVRQGNTRQIRTDLQTKMGVGMQTMDRALAWLVAEGYVDRELAREKSQEIKEFDQLLESIQSGRQIAKPRFVRADDLPQTIPNTAPQGSQRPAQPGQRPQPGGGR